MPFFSLDDATDTSATTPVFQNLDTTNSVVPPASRFTFFGTPPPALRAELQPITPASQTVTDNLQAANMQEWVYAGNRATVTQKSGTPKVSATTIVLIIAAFLLLKGK